MSNKFVLESFESYLRFIEDNIYEAKEEFVPTIDFVKGYVQRLLEKQKEIGKETPSFLPYADKENPYEAWLEKWKTKKGNEGKEYPAEKGKATYYGALGAPYLWDKLTDDQKNEVYNGFLEKIKKSGYKKEKDINKLISDKKTEAYSPYISITPSFVEIPPTIKIVPKPFTITGLDEGAENELFKDNRWGSGVDSVGGKVNPDAFNNPASLEEIRKEIGDFMKNYASGAVTKLNSVRIESSASRYRNTNEKGGKAENISWGELSYNRAMTILDLFREAADANNLSDEKKKELQSKILIDSKGKNGDGTSGPNPIAPNRFGYYDEKGKFIESNGTFGKGKDATQNRNLKVIAELGEGGKPTGKYTTAEEAPAGKPEDYNEYRYVNFFIDGEMTDGGEEEKVIETPGRKEVKYTPVIKFPKISSGGSSTRQKKRGRRTIGIPGKGSNPFVCPEF